MILLQTPTRSKSHHSHKLFIHICPRPCLLRDTSPSLSGHLCHVCPLFGSWRIVYFRSELRFRSCSITFPYCRLLLFSHTSETNITATDTSRPSGQRALQMHPMNNIAYCCIVQFHIHLPRIQGRVHVPVSEPVDLESDSRWDGCECSTGYKA